MHMTTHFVDTAGKRKRERETQSERQAPTPLYGLFAAQDFKQNDVAAYYQLVVFPTWEQAVNAWENRHKILDKLDKDDIKTYEANFEKLLELQPLFERFKDYAVSYDGYLFYPDLSYGRNVGGKLWDKAVFQFKDKTYPGLSGMFANEPDPDQSPNVQPAYDAAMKAKKLGKSEKEHARRPKLYLQATKHIKPGAELLWCYGNSYGPRDYQTSCSKDAIEAPEEEQISKLMLDAIVVYCLLDVTGRIDLLTKRSGEIGGPAEMAQLYNDRAKIVHSDVTTIKPRQLIVRFKNTA